MKPVALCWSPYLSIYLTFPSPPLSQCHTQQTPCPPPLHHSTTPSPSTDIVSVFAATLSWSPWWPLGYLSVFLLDYNLRLAQKKEATLFFKSHFWRYCVCYIMKVAYDILPWMYGQSLRNFFQVPPFQRRLLQISFVSTFIHGLSYGSSFNCSLWIICYGGSGKWLLSRILELMFIQVVSCWDCLVTHSAGKIHFSRVFELMALQGASLVGWFKLWLMASANLETAHWSLKSPLIIRSGLLCTGNPMKSFRHLRNLTPV